MEVLKPAIQKAVQEHPAWGVRKVWALLRSEGLPASQKRIYALMRDLGLQLPVSGGERPAGPRGHVVVPDSNRRWATDLTTVWTKQDGVVAVAPVVDCGDRVCLALHVSLSQEARAMLAPVREACLKAFGRPDYVPHDMELRTDHDTQYTAADCRDFCQEWRLEHTFAPAGRPTGNAVAERLIQTLKVECIWLKDWESRAQLQAALDIWRQTYNTGRPHQALGWRTPQQQRDKNLANNQPATALSTPGISSLTICQPRPCTGHSLAKLSTGAGLDSRKWCISCAEAPQEPIQLEDNPQGLQVFPRQRKNASNR